MRVSWNQKDNNYLATINLNQKTVNIIDIRFPMLSVAELVGHQENVNCIGWSPESRYMIASGGEDSQTHIFDLSKSTQSQNPMHTENYPIDPILLYSAESPIVNLQWPKNHPGWIGIAFDMKIQLLKI